MKKHFDAVTQSFDVLIIPRNKEDDGVVIMSLKEYNSFKETEYLLATEANRIHLQESMDQVKRGETIEIDFDKLKDLLSE